MNDGKLSLAVSTHHAARAARFSRIHAAQRGRAAIALYLPGEAATVEPVLSTDPTDG
ncbi:MAG TPA: hypothetical protein VMT29_12380 [Steroidobacteraceae bacterium]|nr:hypothetical protein [Steroidobacteraceae bacterium]